MPHDDVIAQAAGRAWVKQSATPPQPADMTAHGGVVNQPVTPAIPSLATPAATHRGLQGWLRANYSSALSGIGANRENFYKQVHEHINPPKSGWLGSLFGPKRAPANNVTPQYTQFLNDKQRALMAQVGVPYDSHEPHNDGVLNAGVQYDAAGGRRLRLPNNPANQYAGQGYFTPQDPKAGPPADLYAWGSAMPRSLIGLHERQHLLQNPPPAQAMAAAGFNPHDQLLSSLELPAANAFMEPAAVLTEMAHAADAAKQVSGRPVTGDVQFSPQYSMPIDELRREGSRAGVLSGRRTAQEALNTPAGQAWLRMQMQQHADAAEKRNSARPPAPDDIAARFQPDYTPEQLEHLGVYDALYREKAPRLASLGEWKPEWVSEHDPKGWAQWYKRYVSGRRIPDEDERQIKRWLSFKARHGGPFAKNPTPRRGWALRNWGIDPTKLVAPEQSPQIQEMLDTYKNRKMQQYVKEKVAEQTAQTAGASVSAKPPSAPPALKQPSLVGKALGYKPTTTLGAQIGRWYQNTGGLNKAIGGAQQAQQNNAGNLNRNTWPTWQPGDVTNRHVPITESKPFDAETKGYAGYYDANSGNMWLNSSHLAAQPNERQSTLEHELSHAAYTRDAATGFRQTAAAGIDPDGTTVLDPNWNVPRLAATKATNTPGMRSSIMNAAKIQENSYTLSPDETDVRLAEIKRRYAHHTGQLVTTPEQAKDAWEWWRQNAENFGGDAAERATLEKSQFKLYDQLPDEQKQQLFHRMPELVQNNANLRKFGAAHKQADLLPEVQLQEHQQRIADRTTSDDPRLLVYHGLGSGKSLSALAAAEAAKKVYGDNYGIVAPASLRGNFQKEVKKFTTSHPEIMSYTGLGMGKQFTEQPETLVMDEAHRLRNPEAASAQAAAQAARKAKRLLLLTGSPITNNPSDLANLLSLLHNKPMSPEWFEKRFVGYKKVNPGVLNWLRGIKPGEQPVVQHENELRKLLAGKVDYQPSKTPEGVNVNEEIVRVPLSPEQNKIQRAIRTKIPPGFLWKLDKEFPLSRDELAKLNSFMTGLRQVSLSTQPFRSDKSPDKAFNQSAKLRQAFENLKTTLDSDPRKKAIIYSNFIDSGLRPYASALEKAQIPHAFFHGGVSPKVRQAAVDAYNAGKLRALLIGPAGAEGLSTRGTSLIQLLDPHWHESRSQQARGRGLRFDSHVGLPEELKNVAVQRYISSSEDPSWLGKLMGYQRERTGDEMLEHLTAEKEKLNDAFRAILREEGTAKAR